MSDTVLVRALVGFAGGPRVGATGPVDADLADVAIDAGFAVRVDKLEDRLPDASWKLTPERQAEVDAAAKPAFSGATATPSEVASPTTNLGIGSLGDQT